jgi:hypothetical protein
MAQCLLALHSVLAAVGMRLWCSVLGVLVTVATALSLTAAPASAARQTFPDRANDAHRGVDILSVRVVNDHRIRIRTTFDALRDRGFDSTFMGVYVDTNRRNPGPEFLFDAGLFWEGHAFRTDRWRDRTPRPLWDCGCRWRAQAGRLASATFVIDHDCFRRINKVRVSV